jgi:lipopolysaccharide/colanic/teichoic acid biosynthesis glycosyltransferase
LGIYDKHLKRAFDLFLAVGMLIVLSPLLLAIVLKIRKEDGGAVFYRGVRVGRNGRPFKIYKFRTMVMNAEALGGSSTSDFDARITECSLFLRKYKLDELPQLINVVLGEMSFVGPRPEVAEYVELYTGDETRILTVRPGITDWASIWNPNEGEFLSTFPNPDKAYLELIRPKKLELQKKYVDEIGFLTDLRILFLTFRTMLTKRETVVDPDEQGGNAS